MSVWDNFNRLTTLSIVFPDSSADKSATIFGNGKNQVPVLIKVKATDKNGVTLDISAAELSSAVTLVNYASGQGLGSPWSVSSSAGDYPTPYSYGNGQNKQSLDVAANMLTLYVSAANISATKNIDIAVRLTVPGVGDFDTTAEGTDTKNGPGGTSGSVFKSPSYVHVTALLPLDYSNTSLLNLSQSGWDLIGYPDFIVHDWKWDGAYYTKSRGCTLTRSRVTVRPKASEFTFTSVSSAFTRRSAANAVTSKPTWHHAKEYGFDTYRNVTEKDTFVAVGGFGKSVDNPDYDTYLWYGPGENLRVSGHFHMIDSEYQYRAKIGINDDHTGDNTTTEVIFYGYRIHVPTGKNTSHNGWNDTYGPLNFTVTDNFGNTGSFSVSFFSDQSHYLTVGNVRLD